MSSKGAPEGQASEFALNFDSGEQFLAAVHIDLVTTEVLATQLVDAAAMAKGLSDKGHIAVDGVPERIIANWVERRP